MPESGEGLGSRIAGGMRSFAARVPYVKGLSPIGQGFALLVGIGIVALLCFVQVSSTPQFCGTCHIMKPYYRSWQHSAHNKVACVECHISPGITAEVRKKYEALSMVVKYFTATYGTRPWGEVDDAACLRCHQRRLLEGQVDYHGVLFDHRPHLSESRRGLRLRCTSCHSQIVQGQHLVVTTSTCALCHFQGQSPGTGLGACRRCHQVPDRVTNEAGMAFDHSQVSTLGMACTSCHGNVVRGDGQVAKERCLACHNQAERLARYGETVFLHEMHVTRHKVDCQGCHATIEHGLATPDAALAAAQAPNPCESCHGSGHSPQQDLYAGIGGRGVPRVPSPMYLTGVTCQGCHNSAFSSPVATGEPMGPHAAPAGAVSCMSCHGPTYQRIFEAWRAAVDQRTTSLGREMDASVAAMGVDPPSAWEDARHNYLLVSRGLGIHNINFAYVLLDRAFEQMNQARQVRGLPALARPWTAMAESPCLSCHLGIDSQSGDFGGRAFSHQPHLVQAKLDCEKCHRKHNERPAIEVVRFGPDGCTQCHHQGLEPNSFTQCSRCHGDVMKQTVMSYRGEFSHQAHIKIGEECASCHQLQTGDPRPSKARCTECHA